jgi:diketogulonate reductase-like aldo/keto reductase
VTESALGAVILRNGVKMPWIGLGTFAQGPRTSSIVRAAIEAGYRSIDTGSFYQNEENIGQGIRDSGIARERLFITTKVWNSEHGYDATLKSFDVSQKKLGLDYLDLYLVHWPVKEKYHDTWRALEKLYGAGKVRSIGVSNFEIHHLESLKATAPIRPMVNQIELHPLKSSPELRRYCAREDIQVEAWSPLAQGLVLNNPEILAISSAHSKTPSQIILRWHYQNGVVAIPKSDKLSRMMENFSLSDFSLSEVEVEKINRLNEERRLLGFDSDHIPQPLLEAPASPWPYGM